MSKLTLFTQVATFLRDGKDSKLGDVDERKM
jgi:hypothetical protein